MSRPTTNALQLVYSLPRLFAGKMLFVDSTNGSYSYSGNDPSRPCRSINQAVASCRDDLDDVIIVMPGYNNTNIDAESGGDDVIDLDVDGITVLASKNCTVQAIASGGSIFQIGADNVTLGVLEGGQWLVVNAEAGTTSTIVEIQAGSTNWDVSGFTNTPGGTTGNYDQLFTIAATAHKGRLHHNNIVGDLTDTDAAVVFEGTVDGITVDENIFVDCGAGGALGNIYSNSAHTNCLIKNNIIKSVTASKNGINFAGASATGLIIGNLVYATADVLGIVNQNCAEFRNYVNDAFTTSDFVSPAAGTITSDRRAKLEIVYLKAA